MTSGIYCITNKLNGKRYIGSSSDVDERWHVHRYYLRAGKHHSRHLQSAWKLYGEDAFEFRTLLICEDFELLRYEQELLDRRKPEYNLAPVAGSLLGYKRSPETCARMSLAQMGNTKMLGKKHSEETKARIGSANAISLKGNKIWLGKKHTEESKAKMSKSHTGKEISGETRQKMSIAHRKRRQNAYS